MRSLLAVSVLSLLLIVITIHAPGSVEAQEDSATVIDLIALAENETSAFKVGEVGVWNDDNSFYVKYKITLSDWCLTETNLHVAESLAEIPVNKNGKPQPGRFDHSREYDCVASDTYGIPMTWQPGTDLFLAANALVQKRTPMSFDILSGAGGPIFGPIYADPFANSDPLDDWITSSPSLAAKNWIGMEPNPLSAACGNPSFSMWNWGNGQTTDIPSTQWISTAENTSIWWQDSWRYVQESFTVPNLPSEVSVTVNADNEYWVYANGVQVGHDASIFGPLLTHAFTPVSGANTLEFVFKNAAMGMEGNVTHQCGNPNGLTYRALVESYDEDAAWADGAAFPGGNRETYFMYTVPACVQPPSDLVSWWPADDDADDAIGVNDGTLQDGATFAFGKVGPAFSLDGVDDYLMVGNPPTLRLTGDLTIDAWINLTQDPAEGQVSAIAGKWGNDVSIDAYELSTIKQGGVIMLASGVGDGLTSDTGLIGGSIQVQAWTHVALTYDADTGENVIYVNGASVDSQTRLGGIYDSGADFLIGARDTDGGPTSFFPGLIDEVQLFDRALSLAEVQSIYTAGSGGKCKPQLLETVEVFPDTNPVLSISVLEVGKSYILEVSGTFTNSPGLPGGAGIADAKYALRAEGNWNPGPGPQWISGDTPGPPITHYLELLVNGGAVAWGPFNPAHVYAVTTTGTGTLVSFQILDTYLPDNSGSLFVRIYELP